MTSPSEVALLPNLPPVETLSLWEDLVSAMYGVNGFGGNTAEIYAYRLYNHRPATTQGEAAVMAGENLFILLTAFNSIHSNLTITVNGVNFDEWNGQPFDHRVHVEVFENE